MQRGRTRPEQDARVSRLMYKRKVSEYEQVDIECGELGWVTQCNPVSPLSCVCQRGRKGVWERVKAVRLSLEVLIDATCT